MVISSKQFMFRLEELENILNRKEFNRALVWVENNKQFCLARQGKANENLVNEIVSLMRDGYKSGCEGVSSSDFSKYLRQEKEFIRKRVALYDSTQP